jgi:hypothetical protein
LSVMRPIPQLHLLEAHSPGNARRQFGGPDDTGGITIADNMSWSAFVPEAERASWGGLPC